MKFFAENYLCGNIQQKILGDFDGNGKVDFVDFALFVENWLSSDPERKGDLNDDGIVNFVDFAEFATVWQDN